MHTGDTEDKYFGMYYSFFSYLFLRCSPSGSLFNCCYEHRAARHHHHHKPDLRIRAIEINEERFEYTAKHLTMHFGF